MSRLPSLLAVLLLAAPPALAHKLKVFATLEGAEIAGSAYFAGGDKAAGVPGRLLGADGSLAGRFVTALDGTFRASLPSRQDHTILVEAEDGHAATFVIRAADIPSSLPAAGAGEMAGNAALEAAIARQIRPLREQLDAYESRVRLHDLMGGIGTIFGLFGCWAWLRSRKGESP